MYSHLPTDKPRSFSPSYSSCRSRLVSSFNNKPLLSTSSSPFYANTLSANTLRPLRNNNLQQRHQTKPIASSLLTASTSTLSTYIHRSIDPIVLASTATASFKLFLICATVGFLLKSKRIPNNTASVLSQVSFQLLIPCMLFSKVATTVAAQSDATLMIGMAIGALVQVGVGAFWGTLLSPLVDGQYPRHITLFGWHPASPSKPAAAIASATALATGLDPSAASALLPRPPPVPRGARQLVAAACTYGNSFTLPCVFFLSLLPPAVADTAIAYAGLFLLAWSPCLWSFGLRVVQSGFKKETASEKNSMAGTSGRRRITTTRNDGNRRSENRDDYIEDETVVRGDAWPLISQRPSSRRSLLKSIIFQGQSILSLKNRAIPSISAFFSNTLNPPIFSILCGLIVGVTPLGKHFLFSMGSHSAPLPFELSLARSALKCAYEVVEMLSGGTLAMQTLVLASSLLQKQDEDSPGENPPLNMNTTSNINTVSSINLVQSAWKALAPSSDIEARALAVLSVARFVLIPMTSLLIFKFLSSLLAHSSGTLGLSAVLTSNSLFLFVLAVQSVMPSAQNLIIMLQLSESTRPAAPAFAKLLLKLYAYAVLPVTLWVTAFASRLAIPLI